MKHLLTTLFIFTLAILSNLQSQSQCHIDDWTALKALYESTDGDNWSYRVGWDVIIDGHINPPANCDLSILNGIQIGGQGRVTQISLSSKNLTGTIPLEIGNLTELNYIDLFNNNLSGEIPLELFYLTKLIYLNLRYNQLIGNIPSDLSNLLYLEELLIDNNAFTGSIPYELENLTNLTNLSLSDNGLTGTIPTELSNLINLEHLYLSNNQLSGTFPIELKSLTNLLSLTINHNYLDIGEFPFAITYLTNLTYLRISHNNFSGCYNYLLNFLCDQLTYNDNYFISNGNLFDETWEDFCSTGGGECFTHIPNCHIDDWTALKAIYESTNGYNWTIRTGWDGMIDGHTHPPPSCDLSTLYGINVNLDGRVKSINLDYTNLSGDIPTAIINLIDLTDLSISSNNVSGDIPIELGYLTNLSSINLSYNFISGSIPDNIGGLENLAYLNLSNNMISGSIPNQLGTLYNLTSLYLYNNNLVGCYGDQLMNLCTQLQEINNNYISYGNNFDDLWEAFCSTNAGTCLQTPSCHIDDWTALKALYESTNGASWLNRTGWNVMIDGQTSPPNNCNLTALYGVHVNEAGRISCIDLDGDNGCSSQANNSFQGNKLTGILPNEISLLSHLTKLFLSHNKIESNIPAEIGGLTNLTHLHLASNKFHSQIPPEIGDLVNLEDLFLYANRLTGSIPPEIGNLTNLTSINFGFNYLEGEIPLEISNLVNLTNLYLGHNYWFQGGIPQELGNLVELEYLVLNNCQFNGNIPQELTSLLNLKTLSLSSNKLTGEIPDFSSLNLNNLYLSHNYFSCEDISQNYANNQYINNFTFNQQYFGELSAIVIDTAQSTSAYLQFPSIPSTGSNTTYSWDKIEGSNHFEDIIDNSQILTIDQVVPSHAGAYRLHIVDDCFPNMTFQSEPIYLIVKGYDLNGQPVEYNEIMVEFNSPAATQFYENEILFSNAGWVTEACNCNRELYLWKFNNAEDAMAALIEIDKKKQTIEEEDSDIDGGFNNYINVGNTDNGGIAYDVLSNMSGNYPDDVSIYLLDTGLDDTGISNTPHLMSSAPVDNCYAVNSAPGYNYTGTSIDNNYLDQQGHGTFGFRSITDELSHQSNGIDVVPLKVFNENGEGNLFDLTCAVYHAIDHNADIINISAGYRGQPSSILEKAINIARENGVFICTAAGNDTLDIDVTPQYPAYFAGQYHYEYDDYGNITNSFRYDNVISVAAIDAQNNLVEFSNYGQDAVTISAYGENIHSYGLAGSDEIWSGTSMATYFVSRELALEIASNKNRTYDQIWSAFENNSLTSNTSTIGKTRTAKQLNVTLDEYIPPCTGCNCNNRMSSKVMTINSKFGRFANDEFVNNYITAEKSYINHRSEIHDILTSKDSRYSKVQQNFKKVKDMALAMLFQSFIGKGNSTVSVEHIQLIDAFLNSLSQATNSKNLKNNIESARKYLHVMKGEEVKDALIAFDRAGLKDENDLFENIEQIDDDFKVELVNAVGREAYLTYQSNTSGTVYINLFDVEGRNVQELYQKTINEGVCRHKLSKQNLARGIYYLQVNFKSNNSNTVSQVLKLSVVH